jgi:hemerythrin
MVLAVWKDSYATGYHKIDNQHKELFGMINELHKSILAGKDKDIHLDILNQLSRYIVNHFSLEESIMLIMNYPSYD